MSPEARTALKDDCLLTIDEGFDPEPNVFLKHEDFIKRLLNDLEYLCGEPYNLLFRWRMAFVRDNSWLNKLLKILSLDRYSGNGQRDKLNTGLGFKYTLLEFDNLIEACPLIQSCVRDVEYLMKVDRRVVELEHDEMKEFAKKTDQKKERLAAFEAN